MGSTDSDQRLPILDAREDFTRGLQQGAVVLTAPTGSGKSTVAPLWLLEKHDRVLVVEPRRVACRSLARFVAGRLGSKLGQAVGYIHRHEQVAGRSTRLVYVTPGVALRLAQEGELQRFPAVVLDEFHERGLELDLLLALLHRERPKALVVISATIDVRPIARYLDAAAVHAPGRQHPVRIVYLGGTLLPSRRRLEERVAAAVARAANDRGDILVFLPGKAEIFSCLNTLRRRSDYDVIPLHGDLESRDQDRAFEPGARRRVILATNVAETSITLPRIGVVIDSGLVRRTRYHHGRGVLALMPVALDSADQRSGRAGRLFPGRAYRLWEREARLDATTPPEMLRESLTQVVLAVAACGLRMRDLEFLDPPAEYAVSAALADLQELGAIDSEERLTEYGRRMARLPVDAFQARLLVEALQRGIVADAVDLVAALSVGRSLFRARVTEDSSPAAEAYNELKCDAAAMIRALRRGDPRRAPLHADALAEARRNARQLREILGAPRAPADARPNREALARAVLAADRRAGCVRRARRAAWTNGAEEFLLARESFAPQSTRTLVVLDVHGATDKHGRPLLIAAAVLPCSPELLADAGLGERVVGEATLGPEGLRAQVTVQLAGRPLAVIEITPEGELLHQAVIRLLQRGELFPGLIERIDSRLAESTHARRLGLAENGASTEDSAAWLRGRLAELGLENAEELELLQPEDLLPEPLPPELAERLRREFPRQMEIAGVRYDIAYDPGRRIVEVIKRSPQKAPPPSQLYLPSWTGWGVIYRDRQLQLTLRERR